MPVALDPYLILDIILRICVVPFDENHLLQHNVIFARLKWQIRILQIITWLHGIEMCYFTNFGVVEIYLIEIAQR